MNNVTLLFLFFVFLIELPLIYSPLYYVFYGILKYDAKFGDKKLMIVLLISTIILSTLLLNKVSAIIYYLFFKS